VLSDIGVKTTMTTPSGDQADFIDAEAYAVEELREAVFG
jgi:hypothetical protein